MQRKVKNRTKKIVKKLKKSICKHWIQKGRCKLGKKCKFLHLDSIGVDPKLENEDKRPELYKTKPCTHYHMKGYCLYGENCQFLHDEVTILNKRQTHL